MSLLIKVTFDRLLRGLLKLVLVNLDLADLLVGRQYLVQTIAVLLHDVLQVFL